MAKKSITTEPLTLQHDEMGRVSFPTVFEPRETVINGISNGKKQYSLTLLFPKGPGKSFPEVCRNTKGASRIVDMVLKCKREAFGDGKVANFKWPFGDGDEKFEEKPETYGAYKGMVYVRLTANEDRRPGVVNRKVEPILDPAEFYAGCWAIVSCAAWSFENVSKGVGINLLAVQKIKDDARLAGGGTVDPQSVFTKAAGDDQTDDFQVQTAAGNEEDFWNGQTEDAAF